MSVFKRYPMVASMFFANLVLAAAQAAATIAGADSLWAVVVHFGAATMTGSFLLRRRLPSTERQAVLDQRKRDSYNPAEIMVDPQLDQWRAKASALRDQFIELTADVEDTKERAALTEIMYGPHSSWGQTQAIIQRIDAELIAMEHAEWDKRKEAEAKAEAERIAALPPEERKWAAFGGPPERLSPEEFAEIRERVRPVGDHESEDPWGFASRRSDYLRARPITTDELHEVFTWDSADPVRTIASVPESIAGRHWTVEEVGRALRCGIISHETAVEMIENNIRPKCTGGRCFSPIETEEMPSYRFYRCTSAGVTGEHYHLAPRP